MSGALRHRSFCNSFCGLQKKNLSFGGFDPPPPARIRPEMLPLHYNDSVLYVPRRRTYLS